MCAISGSSACSSDRQGPAPQARWVVESSTARGQAGRRVGEQSAAAATCAQAAAMQCVPARCGAPAGVNVPAPPLVYIEAGHWCQLGGGRRRRRRGYGRQPPCAACRPAAYAGAARGVQPPKLSHRGVVIKCPWGHAEQQRDPSPPTAADIRSSDRRLRGFNNSAAARPVHPARRHTHAKPASRRRRLPAACSSPPCCHG